MTKRWMIGLISAGALIGTLVGGSVAMAQVAPTATATPSATQTNPLSTFAGKVAKILGIDQAKVEAAMKQAQQQTVNEREKARLDALVAAGKMTQAQEDAYLAWLAARPADIQGLGGLGGLGGFDGLGKHGDFGGRGHGHGSMDRQGGHQGQTSTPTSPSA